MFHAPQQQDQAGGQQQNRATQDDATVTDQQPSKAREAVNNSGFNTSTSTGRNEQTEQEAAQSVGNPQQPAPAEPVPGEE